jgi:hypothetical protein
MEARSSGQKLWERKTLAWSMWHLRELTCIDHDHTEDHFVYEIVPLTSHEVQFCLWPKDRAKHTLHTDKSVRKPIHFYAGADGDELILQPRYHRKRWSDEQWVAYRERVKELEDEKETQKSEGGALEIYLRGQEDWRLARDRFKPEGNSASGHGQKPPPPPYHGQKFRG